MAQKNLQHGDPPPFYVIPGDVYDDDKPNQDWWIKTDKLTSSSGLIDVDQNIP